MTPCDACNERRLHTAAEWSEFHEFAGHGYSDTTGWTHPGLEAIHEAAAKERAVRSLAACSFAASKRSSLDLIEQHSTPSGRRLIANDDVLKGE